ncbi:ParB/RepB/Spo0J family partition protein [Nitratiruptor sp. YY09-18]|uniref:ParB/RepB/Spo0J family partition protein n=1 Tax=Nitratiruptor sp. YY09-18 TaxID=2724901 RepID=UPI0019168A46|nr:ParB/RepB/Spo0J family partition protein [Nitratiruptor sp. YY09-18]BCD67776.1 ParB family transcriptional regulator, chromosome partitioning protein [Nitratiruptor sp. YY09-18]
MAKKSLGRGLGAILGEVAQAYENEVPNEEVVELDIDAIRRNPYQPRRHFDKDALEELADSIKTHGLLQPIIVIEDIDGYMLIAGERRLRASKLAGLKKIKAIVASIDKGRYREFALIENIQRENLHPLDLAYSYKELIEEYGITHEELADIVKKSRVHITNTLRLLQLSDYAKRALQEGKITAGHAKVLVGVDEEEQKLLVDSIAGQKLSVRDAEKLVSTKKKGVTKSDRAQQPDLKLQELKKLLQSFGFDVKSSKNKVTIHFASQEDIDKLKQLLS